MLGQILNFLYLHPGVLLLLALGWFIAAVISGMPEYHGDNFWVLWVRNVLQIIGGSMDKVKTVAKNTAAFKQIEQELQTTDASGLQKTFTARSTETSATAGEGAIPK